jgi:hypothetical protein
VGRETLKCEEKNKIWPVKIKVKYKIQRKEDGRIKVLFYILFLHVLSYFSVSLYFLFFFFILRPLPLREVTQH